MKWRVLAQGLFVKFLTAVFTFLSLLITIFVIHGGDVWVWGRKLGHGNFVSSLNPFTMLYEGYKLSSFGIKTLWYHHGLVCPRRLVCEWIHDFWFIQMLIVVKQGWYLCHSRIKVADQSHILLCCEFSRIINIVLDVALLTGEEFYWAEIGHNMVHNQD